MCSRHEHHCTFQNWCSETARWNHGACKHAQRAVPLCADRGLCQAACCQAPDMYCTKQHSDAGISSASPSCVHDTNTTAPFATVAAKRPAGITVHASMLKEAVPYALTVVFAKLRAVKHRTCTAQNSIAMPASHLHDTSTTVPFTTVAAKRPAGITVHASMLKERFLMR